MAIERIEPHSKDVASLLHFWRKNYAPEIHAERLRMFTKRTGKKIGIEIINLTDGQGQPTGTSVKILLET